jgi:hypothetical protein
MKTRSLHRVIGIVMLLPLVGWAVTGAIFFIKPGYSGAYESLAIKTYPLDSHLAIATNPAWREVRYVETILGEHLLVRGADGWQQLDPLSLSVRPAPSEADVRALATDAFTANPVRYGHVTTVTGRSVVTDTGARVTLDWNHLTLSQRGTDTDRIDRLYKIHYLQWTGIETLDRVIGGLGLLLLVILSALGARLFFR